MLSSPSKFPLIIHFHRNKAILFYFNMLKCANPAVLINLQCPTTQVRERAVPYLAAHLTPTPDFCSTPDYARLTGFLIKRMLFFPQLCVSKCPDRFSTLLDAWNTKNWEYYKQFCKPGFTMGQKVRDSGFSPCLQKRWKWCLRMLSVLRKKKNLTQNFHRQTWAVCLDVRAEASRLRTDAHHSPVLLAGVGSVTVTLTSVCVCVCVRPRVWGGVWEHPQLVLFIRTECLISLPTHLTRPHLFFFYSRRQGSIT